MQNQPSAAELIQAVEEFIREVAMPNLHGRAAFHGLVAANALGIVRRELEIAPIANAREVDRLAALLDSNGTLEGLNRELCERISKGEVDLNSPGLASHLWETTLTKLAIDQPRYPSYQRALEQPSE